MRENIQKIISVFATIAILCLSIKWIIDSSTEHNSTEVEPIITLIGAFLTLLLQIIGWTPKGKSYTLVAPKGGEPQTIPRLFNFSKDRSKITIKPDRTRRDYWRVGFKMYPTNLINIDSPTQEGAVLFSIEQTSDQIRICVHRGNEQILFNHTIITNYNNEGIDLFNSKNSTGDTIFKICHNGDLQFEYNVDPNFSFGKLISWADNEYYKINLEIKDKFWRCYF
ncbi:hypothetical protein J2T02_005138 [Chitinophaga terrae (ex Kim and Jung 2007)]|uniref:hypothetical protein n=1 Tax=Chitinophaga terrae (ex Kim and Jung 2007) TaxID=408074 RepID=UPI002789F30A|nr:hypothetical protein [Chitinophaga terrae (ex Kim and Jung 2007)]MDQ0109991.1 hypothetical protein [Chitinophaga terrae (ex Kim and Jung 2007)]